MILHRILFCNMLQNVAKSYGTSKLPPPHKLWKVRIKQFGVHRSFLTHHAFTCTPHAFDSLPVYAHQSGDPRNGASD